MNCLAKARGIIVDSIIVAPTFVGRRVCGGFSSPVSNWLGHAQGDFQTILQRACIACIRDGSCNSGDNRLAVDGPWARKSG